MNCHAVEANVSSKVKAAFCLHIVCIKRGWSHACFLFLCRLFYKCWERVHLIFGNTHKTQAASSAPLCTMLKTENYFCFFSPVNEWSLLLVSKRPLNCLCNLLFVGSESGLPKWQRPSPTQIIRPTKSVLLPSEISTTIGNAMPVPLILNPDAKCMHE